MPKHNEMHDIEKLIVLVKNRPPIYDYSCSEHKKKECTDALWQEIADELGMTPTLCKSKWLALRNSYSREIRNEKVSKLHPYSKRKRRKWYLADDMVFLREYLNYGQQNKRESVSDGQTEFESGYTQHDDRSCSPATIDQSDKKFMTKLESELIFDSTQSQSCSFEKTATEPALVEIPMESNNSSLHAYPRHQPSNHQPTQQEEINELQEQNMTFFKSILPDILKLSERRQRLFKQEILSVLNKSLDEQEMGS